MRRIAIALAALVLLRADMFQDASNAKLPEARQGLGVSAYFGAAQDLYPRRHLSNLVNKSSATICAIGDSTLTNTPVGNLTMDESQVIWGILKKKLIGDNPQIRTWSWQNYAIGGSNEAWPYQSATALGLSPLPSWWTDPSRIWLSYIEPLGCDVLFYLFGTNASTAGIGGGSGPATSTQLNLNIVEGWAKKPNIVLITNKSGYFDNFSGGDDANQSAHKGQSAYHRLFARTNAAGFTSLPNLRAMGFGLIDFGRFFEMYVTGKDFANQYLESVPACIVSGRTLGAGGTAGEDASTVCHTPDGDYRISFTLTTAGGTIIGTSGYTHIQVSASRFDANYHRFVIGAGGTLQPQYLLNGTINPVTGTSQSGPVVATTQGGDIAITIAQSGATLQYWIDGVLVWETAAPRFVMGNSPDPGMPVNINALGTPSTPVHFDVTAFWAGHALPTGSFKSYADAYGPGPGTPGCQPAAAGCQGGNSANHYKSSMAAFDRALADGMDFHVPAVSAAPNIAYNGGFQVSQDLEAGTATFGPSTSTYCMDAWPCALVSAGGATLTGQRSTDAPPGGANSFLATVTGAAATAAGDFARIQQPLPAYDVSKLKWGTANALPVFISYDLKTSVPGVYGIAVKNPPGNNRYFTSFCAVANANAWTHCGVMVPGDTGGAWALTGNAKGLTVDLMLSTGSSLTSGVTSGIWQDGNKYALSNQTNLTETNGATFQVANFKLEIGTAPTPFVSTVSEELSPERLLKFYRKTMPQGTAWAAAAGLTGALCTTATNATAGTLSATWDFGSAMNAAPLVAAFNPSVAGGGWRNVTAGTDAVVAIDPVTAIGPGRVQIGSTITALTVGNQYCIHARARAPL